MAELLHHTSLQLETTGAPCLAHSELGENMYVFT